MEVRRLAFVLGGIVLLLVVAQFALPKVAEHYVRDQVTKRGGDVASVHVSAFPAVKLLWKHADSVDVKVRSAKLGVGDLADELQRTKGVDKLDATVDTMQLGPLKLRDLALHKRGNALNGQASVTRQDLASALPVDVGLRPVQADSNGLVLEGSVGPITARARLAADNGAVKIAPEGLLGALATLTVFDDPRVWVESVGARTDPAGFTLTARGRLA